MLEYIETPVVKVDHPLAKRAGISVFMKREELNHPEVSGNKWWKLKYNLETAVQLGKSRIVTFGGAYSNHIYATAAAARAYGLDSTGIVRGEATTPLNATLSFAESCGMELIYVARSVYRGREEEGSLVGDIRNRYPDAFIIPEGGTNSLALQGVREFGKKISSMNVSHVCVPVGTGGTMAGLILAFRDQVHIRGYAAIKGGVELENEIGKLLKQQNGNRFSKWSVCLDGHYGGYAKVTPDLLQSLREFETVHGFRLDPVYTGKMIQAFWNDVERGFFSEGSVVMLIHTGGLQGWKGMNERYPYLF